MSQTINIKSQLGTQVVAYICSRRMRVVTLVQPVLDAIYEQLVVTRVYREKGRYKQELVETFERQNRNGLVELMCLSGFLPRLLKICRAVNVPLTIVDVERNATVDNVLRIPPIDYYDYEAIAATCRDWHKEALALMQHSRFGRMQVSTGGGKSWLIATYCKLARKQRILVTTAAIQDLANLHNKIVAEGVDAQLLKGTSKPKSRVICCTTGRLKHLQGTRFDVTIGDEIHEHATPTNRANLWEVDSYQIFGMSANDEDRSDKADLWIEGIYGPLLLKRTYQENQAAGDVCPIKVTVLPSGTSVTDLDTKSLYMRERYLITRNHVRNQQIAAAARDRLNQGRQVLILVKTTEHALQVRKWLPEALAVFGVADEDRWQELRRMGLTRDNDLPGFTNKQLQEVQAKFKARIYRAVVANSIWFKGKDFPSLDVVVRGDAQSNKVANTQLSGRLSRTYVGKNYGELVDFRDEWDRGLFARWKERKRFYKSQGYEVYDAAD